MALLFQEDSWYSYLPKTFDPRARVQLEGLHKLKNSMALLEIEPCYLPASTMLPCAPINIPLKERIEQFVMVFLADS
jgi:hypothetical protein